ncbi:MAG: hypothetical protein AB2659_11130 [Candidatus Thiodiazotropha sp.]
MEGCAVVSQDDFIGLRVEYTNDCLCVNPVATEHAERIVVTGFLDTEQIRVK